MTLSRRKFLQSPAVLAGTFAGGTMLNAYQDTDDFQWPHEVLAVPELPEALNGLSIVHESDLHADKGSPLDMTDTELVRFMADQRRVFEALGLNPQKTIRVNTGDNLTHSRRTDAADLRVFERYAEAQSDVRDFFAKQFYVEGNHEFRRPRTRAQVRKILEKQGYQSLNQGGSLQASREIIAGQAFKIFGFPDFLTYPEAYEGIDEIMGDFEPDADFNLVLTHNIEGIEPVLHRADIFKAKVTLALAGHTHGGQISLPFVTKKILQEHGYSSELIAGLYNLRSGVWARINRGMGLTQSPKMRFNCPPEIPIITLKKAG